MRYRVEHDQATIYYLVYYINTLLTRRRRLNSPFEKRTLCHSFMTLNRASDGSEADLRSQTHVKSYVFPCREILIKAKSTPVYIIIQTKIISIV